MLYRDGFLILIALGVHVLYIISKNKDLHFALIGLYIVYIILDLKNDAFTHLGMKLLGRIKDDDSFEGEIPMRMKRHQTYTIEQWVWSKRTAKNFRFEYSKLEEILDEKRDKYYTYLKFHRVLVERLVTIMLANKPEYPDLPEEERQELRQKKINLYMKFGRAVYKLLFLLRVWKPKEKSNN